MKMHLIMYCTCADNEKIYGYDELHNINDRFLPTPLKPSEIAQIGHFGWEGSDKNVVLKV